MNYYFASLVLWNVGPRLFAITVRSNILEDPEIEGALE